MIKIYNVKNHRLDSDKLTFLNKFNSDDFCGVAIPPQSLTSRLSDVFKLDSTGNVTVNDLLKGTDSVNSTDLTFINGGAVIEVPFNDIQKLILVPNHFYYIKYRVNCSFDESNTYNDNFDEASIEHLEYTNYTVTAYDLNGIEVPTSDESCVGVMSNVTLSDGTIMNYVGKSIKKSMGDDHILYYIIPLFLYDGSKLVSLIEARNKSSFEQWLSAKSLDNLWETLHSTFTHQSGSTSENPDYGKLGEFNFSGNTVSHNTTQVVKLEDGKFTLPTYKSDKDNALYTDKNGKVLNGNLPIEAGGTNASNKNDAKNNLGIYYGVSDPEVYCANNNITPIEGDIYFKILN